MQGSRRRTFLVLSAFQESRLSTISQSQHRTAHCHSLHHELPLAEPTVALLLPQTPMFIVKWTWSDGVFSTKAPLRIMIKKKNCGKPGAHSLSSNQFPQSPFPEPKSFKVVDIKILGEWYFCRLSTRTSADIQNLTCFNNFFERLRFSPCAMTCPSTIDFTYNRFHSRCIFEGVRTQGRKAIAPNSPNWGALGYRKFPKPSPSAYKPLQTV